MGAYLAQPKTEKESSCGSCPFHRWGSSAMQGWRSAMEDSHIAMSQFGSGDAGESLSLFAVFDGHGGREVAAFCAEHLAGELSRQRLHLDSHGNMKSCSEALVDSFHRMDNLLRQPHHQQELKRLKQVGERPCHQCCCSNAADDQFCVKCGARLKKDTAAVADHGDPPKPRVLCGLQSAIQSDLAIARKKGALTKEDATQIMMKMALMRRLEAKIDNCRSPGGMTTAEYVGCTAVCVILSEASIVCANAGDSRAVLCRAGTPVELTHDHKPNIITERTRIEAAGGHVEEIPVGAKVHYRVNGNLNLSRAIGDLAYKTRQDLGPEAQIISATPDIISYDLQPEDEFIVLACDGIWDVKTNAEVCEFVRSKLKKDQPIHYIIEELLDDCCAKHLQDNNGLGGDNMTCIVVELLK